jgi:hypothetical protein
MRPIGGRANDSCARRKNQVQEIQDNIALARRASIRGRRRAQRKALTLIITLLTPA